MGYKLKKEHQELFKAVDEVLFYIWDPIGVSDQPYARDEYSSYVSNIFSLLLTSENGLEVKNKLIEIEKKKVV